MTIQTMKTSTYPPHVGVVARSVACFAQALRGLGQEAPGVRRQALGERRCPSRSGPGFRESAAERLRSEVAPLPDVARAALSVLHDATATEAGSGGRRP